MFKVKVPTIFFGTQGFSARRDGRYYSNSGKVDKGILIEAPIHVATSHDTMRPAATRFTLTSLHCG